MVARGLPGTRSLVKQRARTCTSLCDRTSPASRCLHGERANEAACQSTQSRSKTPTVTLAPPLEYVPIVAFAHNLSRSTLVIPSPPLEPTTAPYTPLDEFFPWRRLSSPQSKATHVNPSYRPLTPFSWLSSLASPRRSRNEPARTAGTRSAAFEERRRTRSQLRGARVCAGRPQPLSQNTGNPPSSLEPTTAPYTPLDEFFPWWRFLCTM